jgi:uncharacterized protein involved in outer membrane biogenesis
VIVLAALLLTLFLVRPGVNRLRTRIVQSVSFAVGRPVEVSWVKLRMFPQPGFDLENFVVHDDPAFSAEPMLRAQNVTAFLRVSSLLRGRIDVARLNLTEPSLNLARNPQGHWNLEDLLERASRTLVAPTGKARSEKRPGFPYIESDNGRINLKIGSEKTAYALTEADFAFWQDSENSWGMRLKARPVRTDLNLTDTGIVRVEGSWQRAASLRATPVHFIVQWQQGQLGQASKLIYGADQGWRGTTKVSTVLAGTPGDLTVHADGSVDDFRRYDVFGGGDLALAARCDAHYSSADRMVSMLRCEAPTVNGGTLMVDGSVTNPTGMDGYDLAVNAKDFPIQSLVSLLRHARRGVPDELLADGRISAKLQLRRVHGEKSATLSGSGEATEFRLSSKATSTDLPFGTVPLAISSASEALRPRAGKASLKKRSAALEDAQVTIGPLPVALGKGDAAAVRGTISRDGYGFSLQGEADLQKLLQTFHAVGLPAPQTRAEGAAKVDLRVAGGWSGGGRPMLLGKVQLRAVRAQPRGLNQPISIAAATLVLKPDFVDATEVRALVAGTTVTGALSFPRRCEVVGGCATTFNLRADKVAMDQLNLLLSPASRKQSWYDFLSASPAGSPYLLSLRATGKLSADQLVIHKLVANHILASVELRDGKLHLSDVRADLWGGKHIGEWRADFTAKSPQYAGRGTLQRVALGGISQIMKDERFSGVANASYSISASGLTTAGLLSTAGGTLEVEAHGSQFPGIVLAGSDGALQARRLSFRLNMQEGSFTVQDGELETPASSYEFSGTATPDRIINLKLTRNGAPAFLITGRLAEPRVAAVSSAEAQAELKP